VLPDTSDDLVPEADRGAADQFPRAGDAAERADDHEDRHHADVPDAFDPRVRGHPRRMPGMSANIDTVCPVVGTHGAAGGTTPAKKSSISRNSA
jgi:hypothetical protein